MLCDVCGKPSGLGGTPLTKDDWLDLLRGVCRQHTAERPAGWSGWTVSRVRTACASSEEANGKDIISELVASGAVPATVLADLASDPSPTVRTAVAASDRITDVRDDIMEALATDRIAAVREALAANPAAPDRMRVFAGMA